MCCLFTVYLFESRFLDPNRSIGTQTSIFQKRFRKNSVFWTVFLLRYTDGPYDMITNFEKYWLDKG